METFYSSPCKGPMVVILPRPAVVQNASVAGTGASASCLQFVALAAADAPDFAAAAWVAAASAFAAALVPMCLLMLLLLVFLLLLSWLLSLLLLLLLRLVFS